MNSEFAFIEPAAAAVRPSFLIPRIFDRSEESLLCEFKIHREEEVSVTSTLFCGGDWRWQLCSSGGDVLAGAGGFGSEGECREAVAILKNRAASASIEVLR